MARSRDQSSKASRRDSIRQPRRRVASSWRWKTSSRVPIRPGTRGSRSGTRVRTPPYASFGCSMQGRSRLPRLRQSTGRGGGQRLGTGTDLSREPESAPGARRQTVGHEGPQSDRANGEHVSASGQRAARTAVLGTHGRGERKVEGIWRLTDLEVVGRPAYGFEWIALEEEPSSMIRERVRVPGEERQVPGAGTRLLARGLRRSLHGGGRVRPGSPRFQDPMPRKTRSGARRRLRRCEPRAISTEARCDRAPARDPEAGGALPRSARQPAGRSPARSARRPCRNSTKATGNGLVSR